MQRMIGIANGEDPKGRAIFELKS